MKHICLQENDYDCGLACIKMMLSHYHKNKHFLDLDKEIVNRKYSMYDLKKYAASYNLILDGVNFEEKDKVYQYQNSIVLINYGDINHFVIFEKKKRGYIYLIDPNIGKIKLKEDEFLTYFTGFSLIKREIKEFKLERKKIDITQFNYILIYITFLILDFGLLYLISYLGNDQKYLFHQFLIIISLVLLLLSKIKTINNHMNYLDTNICKILNNSKLNTKEKKGLLSLKLYTLKSIYGLVNSVFIISFVSFILILNGWYNALLILALFILSYLHSSFSLIKDNSLNFKLNLLEYKFFKNSDAKSYGELMKESKKIQKSRTSVTVIYQLIVILSVTILNNITQINSFQFMVFNVIYYFVLLSRINYIFKENKQNFLEYRKYYTTYNYLVKLSNNTFESE